MNEYDELHGFGASFRHKPQNLMAEMALLGGILANNKARERCTALTPEMFYDADHGAIFARATELIDSGRPVDAVTLRDEFSPALLAELISNVLMVPNVGEYAEAIRDTWLRRQAIEIGTAAVEAAYKGEVGDKIETVISRAAQDMMEVAYANRANARKEGFAEALKQVIQDASDAYRGEPGAQALFTGLRTVDDLWCGMWPGRLYYLMARSRTGKTAALAQFARHIAANLSGGCVHVFSWEMSEKEYGLINLASETRWSADDIRAGRIGDASEWVELDKVSTRLGQLPIVVSDIRGDFASLAMQARVVHRIKGTKLIAMDFMDLVLRGERQQRMSPDQWLPFLGYQFKTLAKELDVPVLVLRQVNKARDRADSSRPTLTDLPYDGGQAADEVYALWRRELDMPDDPPGLAMLKDQEKRTTAIAEWDQQKADAAGKAEFIATKRRFGKTGSVHLLFNGPRMLLKEYT